ncbi:enoyl-CoA hydratase/isomerase family protein [Oleiphilus messinensis]|uniref:Enoyl-CoA hydratase/isomerase family protein n=1 Tax=Oleiphilus messinensis TaxID=141451 RepID=A0A1Y0IEQ7_9GAMM|nr:enoyl-CoA hydratase-related protein [Oleiphilus messinensis]ARU58750.1 enoyl-CoA hydratase/isomerase family protein [Oleiphilus messinensis]
MSEWIITEVVESAGYALIYLNHPQTRNAITDREMLAGFLTAVTALDKDPRVKVAIVTGKGSAFCSGGNVKHMLNRSDMFSGDALQLYQNYHDGIQQIPRLLMSLDLPLIAAVNGPAYGAGLDLALMCDIRISAEAGEFAENFVKVGIIPGDGGAWLLPKAIGMQRAMQMTLTGDAIDSSTALDWGLVMEVVPNDQLLQHASALAQRIAVNGRQPLRWAKRLLREGQHSDFPAFLDKCALMQAIAHHEEDHEQALQRMRGKSAQK